MLIVAFVTFFATNHVVLIFQSCLVQLDLYLRGIFFALVIGLVFSGIAIAFVLFRVRFPYIPSTSLLLDATSESNHIVVIFNLVWCSSTSFFEASFLLLSLDLFPLALASLLCSSGSVLPPSELGHFHRLWSTRPSPKDVLNLMFLLVPRTPRPLSSGNLSCSCHRTCSLCSWHRFCALQGPFCLHPLRFIPSCRNKRVHTESKCGQCLAPRGPPHADTLPVHLC